MSAPLRKFRFAFLSLPSLSSTTGTLCIVDLSRRSVDFHDDYVYDKQSSSNLRLSFVIAVPTLVLNDCTKKRMFNSFTPSKLLRIYDNSSMALYSTLFSYLDMFENDALPLTRLLEPRQFVTRLRRWREFFDLLFFVWQIRIRSMPISSLWSDS